MVPLNARILDTLRRRGLCPHASNLILAPSSALTLMNNTIKELGFLLCQMVHVACGDVYVERGDMLTISFRGRKVLLPVKSVVAMGVKEEWGGVAVDSNVLPKILQDFKYKDLPIILHIIVPTTHIDDLWSLGCILYHHIFGSPLCNFDFQKINSLILFLYTIASIYLQCL